MKTRKSNVAKETLTPEMGTEIDRLGLDRSWFQWVVDEEGLEFCRHCLTQQTKSSELFDKWYPRLCEFVAAKRRETPLPGSGSMDVLDAATQRILEPKIRDAERVPCRGNYTAAFFIAPLHLLPFVAAEWPASYRHPVFLTPDELAEWQKLHTAEEPDQAAWWFVFQDWDAQLNPSSESFWLRDVPLPRAGVVTPVLVVWGLYWGSLAGGHRAELWEIDQAGNEAIVQDLGDVTY